MEIALTAGAAALLGLVGPWAIGRLPEPPDPEDGKPLYADIARPRWLPVLLAGVAAVAGGLVAWGTGLPELLPAWALVCGVGAWLSYVDARTRLLPYAIVAPLYSATAALVGVAALLASDHRIVVRAVVANVVVYVIFRVMHAIGRRFGGALGYGDVRLAGVLALVLGPLGPDATLIGLYAGFLIGAVFGIALSALKLIDRRSFAFGPYMVAGAVVGAVWGPGLYGS